MKRFGYRKINGISQSMYDGGCERCKDSEGEIFQHLPSHIHSNELDFVGYLCPNCNMELLKSKEKREEFRQKLEKEAH